MLLLQGSCPRFDSSTDHHYNIMGYYDHKRWEQKYGEGGAPAKLMEELHWEIRRCYVGWDMENMKYIMFIPDINVGGYYVVDIPFLDEGTQYRGKIPEDIVRKARKWARTCRKKKPRI